MAYRSITVTKLATMTPDKHIEVSVSYCEGGISFATYRPQARGFYLHVQPLEVSGGFVRFGGFTGFKHLLSEQPRYNAKKMQAEASGALSLPMLRVMVEAVLSGQSLQLTPEALALLPYAESQVAS